MQTTGTFNVKESVSENIILNNLFKKIYNTKDSPIDFNNIKIEKIEKSKRVGYIVDYDELDDYTADIGTRKLETSYHNVWYTDDKGRQKQKNVRHDERTVHWKKHSNSKTMHFTHIVFDDQLVDNNKPSNNAKYFKEQNDSNKIQEDENEHIEVPNTIIDKAVKFSHSVMADSIEIEGVIVNNIQHDFSHCVLDVKTLNVPILTITYSYRGKMFESVYDLSNGKELKFENVIEKSFDNEIEKKAKAQTSKCKLIRNIMLCIVIVLIILYATNTDPNTKNDIIAKSVIAWLLLIVVFAIEGIMYKSVYNKQKKENSKEKNKNYDRFISNNNLNENDDVKMK